MPLTPEKISVLVERLTTVLKATKTKKNSEGKTVFEPVYSEYYRRTVELLDEARVHADGTFPEKLLKEKAPNQDPEEFKYQKGIYEPRTKAYWDRAQGTVNRIWNKQNYSIRFSKEEAINSDAPVEKYFKEDFPVYDSIIYFFESIVSSWKTKDGGAVITIRPIDIPMREDLDEFQNPILVNDDTAFIEPTTYLFDSRRVVEYVKDEYALLVTNEKSEVDMGNGKKVKEGFVYELYDDENIYRINQTGKKSDYEFEVVLFYNHATGILPAYKLKGRPIYFEDAILYLSHFSNAIPNLNIAVKNGSTLDVCTFANAFPQRWEYVEACPGEGGFMCAIDTITGKYYIGDAEGRHICSTCHGTGGINKHSPLGVYQLKASQRTNPEDAGITPPGIGYVEPNTAILEFLSKSVTKDILDAFAFLNMDVSNTDVQPTQDDTAIGKKIDREELFSFLLLISNELFDLLKNCINIIGLMRYGGKWQEPEIKYPTDFAIRSEADLTEELSASYEANLPDVAKRAILKQYTGIRFNSSGAVEKINDITLLVDRLATKKELEINSMLSVGRAAKWEAVLHDSIAIFISEKLATDEKYLEKEVAVIKAELVTMAKDLAKEINTDQQKVTPGTILTKLTNNVNAA